MSELTDLEICKRIGEIESLNGDFGTHLNGAHGRRYMAIDEINTMRDIHHTDNLTPADHWDKESLHEAQVLLAKARGEIK